MTRRYLLAALLALAAAPATAQKSSTPTGFLDGTARVAEQTMPYVVYVPRDYSSDRKWPVVLFLHGAGERGNSGLPQSQVGIGSAIRMHPDRFPCLVVMPQCPTGKGWGAPLRGVAQETPETAALALAALDEVMKKYSCDPDRVALTGLSMGGYGTWYLGAKYPDRFSALMPICGGGQPAEMAPNLKDEPIWVFHGDADPTVPVQRSRDMVKALQDAGSTKVRLTEFPGVGHNSWDKAYDNEEAIRWLLDQRRGK